MVNIVDKTAARFAAVYFDIMITAVRRAVDLPTTAGLGFIAAAAN